MENDTEKPPAFIKTQMAIASENLKKQWL